MRRRVRSRGQAAVALVGVLVGTFFFRQNAEALALGKSKRVAVFPLVTRGKVNPKVVGAIQSYMYTGPSDKGDIDVYSGRLLRSRLGSDPRRAVRECERSRRPTPCFVKLIRKLRVDELLVGRAVASEEGVKVLVLSIDGEQNVERRAKLVVMNESDVVRQFDSTLVAAVFGLKISLVSDEASVAQAEDTGASSVPSEPSVPLVTTAVEPSVEPPQPPPLPPRPTLADIQAPTLAPSTSGVTARSPTIHVPAPPRHVVTQSVVEAGSHKATWARPEFDLSVVASESSDGPDWLWRSGIATTVIGVLAVGYGAWQGAKAHSIRQSTDRETELMQKQAAARYKNANNAAKRANLAFVVGGGTTLIGSALSIAGFSFRGEF